MLSKGGGDVILKVYGKGGNGDEQYDVLTRRHLTG